jgi:L-malate glycosyltransferase
LEREAQDLNVTSSAQFLGRVPHNQMPDLLAQADIYVSTSLSDGTSVSLLEALAMGLFPVVTDIPSNREWISDGETGFLVEAGAENIFADRIIEAIQNADLREEARIRNLEIVKRRACWEGNIPKMIEIYKHCLVAE